MRYERGTFEQYIIITGSTTILSTTTVSNIDNIKGIMWEWRVMMLKNQLCHHWNKLHYTEIENSLFKLQ